MVLQHIRFPQRTICAEEELYFWRGLPAIASPEEEGIHFVKGQEVKFDTYINSFSLQKWVEYTDLDNVVLVLKLSGKFTVTLLQYWAVEQRGDQAKEEVSGVKYTELDSITVESQEAKEFSFPFVTKDKHGILAFKICLLGEAGVLHDGYYATEIAPSRVRDVKIAIGICTFKREAYVARNMQNLKRGILENAASPLKDRLEIFIADNAGTLKREEIEDKKIHLFYNKNTGGSGGFSRAMVEVNNANASGAGFTHILLMDDDVIFDPESIYRTFAILSLVNEKYKDAFVGGAMFRTDKQWLQYASGEVWRGEKVYDCIYTYNHNIDMRKIECILSNEALISANYQGWWYCVIPMSICRTDNLSLPFFIKMDDIEYSIRNMKHLILLNGINTWHEAFETKYSVSNEYYTARNTLIVSAIHIGLSVNDVKKYLRKNVLYYLSNLKYREAELVCEATDDFCRGVDYLKSLDMQVKHRSVMKGGYKLVDTAELPVKFLDGLYERSENEYEDLHGSKKLFRELTLNGLLLPSNKVAVLGIFGGAHSQTYRAKYIVRYEPITKKGFILKRSLGKFCHCWRLYRKVRAKLGRRYEAVRKEFCARYKELIGKEFWQTKF